MQKLNEISEVIFSILHGESKTYTGHKILNVEV